MRLTHTVWMCIVVSLPLGCGPTDENLGWNNEPLDHGESGMTAGPQTTSYASVGSSTDGNGRCSPTLVGKRRVPGCDVSSPDYAGADDPASVAEPLDSSDTDASSNDGDTSACTTADNCARDVQQPVKLDDLKVDVKFSRSRYASEEAPIVHLTYTNNSNKPVSISQFMAPPNLGHGEVFALEFDGRPVSYVGRLAKLPAKAPSLQIAPGSSLEGDVDLTDLYHFEESGEYTIRFVADTGWFGAKESETDSEVVSNAAVAVIEGRQVAVPNQAKRPKFNRCTQGQRDILRRVLDRATGYANFAVTRLNHQSNSDYRKGYVTWFGEITTTRRNRVKNHFRLIRDALRDDAATYDCGCKQNYFAYVYPNEPNVYFCRAFWSANLEGEDSKAGTIIHEFSHITRWGGTDDHVYGSKRARSLAKRAPGRAVDNADNHEYFCELK